METPLELLQSLFASNHENYLPKIINYCSEAKVFCKDNNKGQDVAMLINSLFSRKEKSEGALILLQCFLPQCSRDTLNANILPWIQHCTKTLINPEDGSISVTSFKLLSELIQLSTNFPEARKEVALSVIPKSLDHCIREAKSPKEDIHVVLECLHQTLHSYGKSCGLHKEEIASLLFSLLESTPQNVHISAKCYLNLAASGTPGANNVNYANNWYLQEKFLLNTLHNMMDLLFENINVNQDSHKIYDLENYKIRIPDVIEKNLIRKKQRLASQFCSVSEYLQVLILGTFPASKKVLPESLLNMIWRGLSINCSTLMSANISSDVTSLLTVISEVNLSCLKILNSLIISCRMNLISYSPFICRILSQILNWTNVQSWPYGIGKPHRSIRMEAYTCATNWITVSRACSGIEKCLDDILSSIISDINIELPILTLKFPAGRVKGKKQRQKTDIPTTLEHIINEQENEDTCKAALDLIPMVLSSISPIMKPDQYKLLQEVVINKLLQIQRVGSSQTPIPYASEKCRLALYRVLLSLCNNYHPDSPPLINYAHVLFSKGMKDASIKVVTFCIEALNNIGKLLKPPFPSLEFQTSSEALPHINIKGNTPKVLLKKGRLTTNDNTGTGSHNSSEIVSSNTSSEQNKNKLPDEGSQSKTHNSKRSINLEKSSKNKEISSDKKGSGINKYPLERFDNNTESRVIPESRIDRGLDQIPIINLCSALRDSENEESENYRSATPPNDHLNNKTERKRDLDEIRDDENLTLKKAKINGLNQEETVTIDDSDEEMLNTFVDEVINV